LHVFLLEDLAQVPRGRREGLRRLHLVTALGGLLAAAVLLLPSY
jgi:hypothetical protein